MQTFEQAYARRFCIIPEYGVFDLATIGAFKTEEHFLAALVIGAAQPDSFSPTESTRLVEKARSHGVAPILYWQLRRMGVDLSTRGWKGLDDEYQAQIRRYLQFSKEFEEIDRTLRGVGIPSICLKGFALAHTVYPNVTLRPMRDLDVLVPFIRRRDALAQMEGLGFVLTVVRPSARTQELYHDYQLTRNIRLEVHYRLLGVHSKFFTCQDLEWFWTQTDTIHRSGMTLTVLKPEAMLLHLCAHAILNHGEPEFLLQRYLDLHLLITTNSEMDWHLVLQHAIGLRWTYAVRRSLEIVREYFATPIPETVIPELDARRPADENVARAFHNESKATSVEIVLNYVQGMGNREKMHWVLDSILPSVEFMRWRYPIRAPWQIPVFYVYRWAVIAGNILETLRNRLKGT